MSRRRMWVWGRGAALGAVILGAVAAAPAAAHGGQRHPAGVEGIWEGRLEVPGANLRVVFRIERGKDGALAGTLDSPDQGASGIPLGSIETPRGGGIEISIPSVGARYTARLAGEGERLEGTFRQRGIEIPLVCKRVERVEAPARPQRPRPPFPYDVEEVSYENPQGKVRLAGTLTLPRKGRPVPAVLLISGSGAEDRDETVFGHKPFLVLADHLTRHGIAVLRVDDRGVGGSTGSTPGSTSEDFAGDALAGVAYLKGRPEIRAGAIGLVGHSEGGVIAPLAASRSPDVAFVVLLAGTGLTGEEILKLQGDRILEANGVPEGARRANREVQERIHAVLKAGLDDVETEGKIREILEKSPLTPAGEAGKAVVQAGVRSVMTPWFRFFLTYDPRPALRKVRCPVLALGGEKDLQVPARENLEAIAGALEAGGNRDVTTKILPGLNHLFQHCKTGSPSEYPGIEETFAPAALEEITRWIAAHTGG